MDARGLVAIILTATICTAILSPIVMRVLGYSQTQLSDTAVEGLTDLLKVALGAIIGWLAANTKKEGL